MADLHYRGMAVKLKQLLITIDQLNAQIGIVGSHLYELLVETDKNRQYYTYRQQLERLGQTDADNGNQTPEKIDPYEASLGSYQTLAGVCRDTQFALHEIQLHLQKELGAAPVYFNSDHREKLEHIIEQMNPSIPQDTPTPLPVGDAIVTNSFSAAALANLVILHYEQYTGKRSQDANIVDYLQTLYSYLYLLGRWLNLYRQRNETYWGLPTNAG